jgi:3-deoxy-manno-octulosonate cytidylyltransferase (CMP-KDO synthetase)
MKIQIVIPARLASTRLPEKLLCQAGGTSVLHHTFRAACRSKYGQQVVIAVDDQRLADECDRFGGHWIMTSVHCPSGTDRIAEVARQMSDTDIFINVQGDEPEIDPQVIDRLGDLMAQNPSADMATVGTPLRSLQRYSDPSCVKIVMAEGDKEGGRAVYFSRSPVPHDRDGMTHEKLAAEPPAAWHHLGIYAYRRDFLAWFAGTVPSPLEMRERLEQLRAIEAGKTILVTRTESAAPGIDTATDLEAFRQRLTQVS